MNGRLSGDPEVRMLGLLAGYRAISFEKRDHFMFEIL